MSPALLAPVTLDDKYLLERGRIYITGTQALARLPIVQKRRDERAGLNTAGFISGYRGSPLGTVDQALWQASRVVASNGIVFRPGVNEDLAATAVWGTQQANAFEGAKYDGVFAMWYGKGPGVDRCGDVFKHGNAAGSSPHGGVLLIAGDDHAAKSSTLPHQSDYAFMDAGIPVLAPAGVQEYARFGVLGWAMSRYSGCWIGFKALTSAIDSSASVDAADGLDLEIVTPTDVVLPPGGLGIRLTDDWWTPEARPYDHKLPAAQAFARANRIDRVVFSGGASPRLGMVTTGKSYLDVLEALERLGIDEAAAARVGLRLLKVGLVWPMDGQTLHAFADGLEEIIVVEEKRPLLEGQVKEILYGRQGAAGPIRILGKADETGAKLFPVVGELDPLQVARTIARRLVALGLAADRLTDCTAALDEATPRNDTIRPLALKRPPHYCSGCPHNTSTKVPEGSVAAAGIGCHIMARLMERQTFGFTQMGGEGAQWVGMAPFSNLPHLFQNLGDGTYFHSGLMAIRQAIAAKVNITYKILFNDGVAMTGGQPVDGELTVESVVRQVLAEGAGRVVVVSDEPEKYPVGAFAGGVEIHHRDELDAVQKDLRATPGVTVMVYDQTCAAEKRRRRKRGTMVDPAKRVVINDLVCEGCGDCSIQSNCLSVVPLETEFGTKRTIDQSSCNKDYSCATGFCPSFVTVVGGTLRKRPRAGAAEFPDLPVPTLPSVEDEPFNILITGVGGTGVVTIGALIGMAAHLEGRGVGVMDMTGAAQKGGSVFTHVRIARAPADVHAVRVPEGGARLILGCDLVVAAEAEVLSRAAWGRTRALVNRHETITAEFTRRSPSYRFPGEDLAARIVDAVGAEGTEFVEAGRLATALLGDSIGVNLFMLGLAWQKGLIPLSAAAIERAIELNGVAIGFNKEAFLWGRRAAHDASAVARIAFPRSMPTRQTAPSDLDTVIRRRVAFLTEYQDAAYAGRYEARVRAVAAAEERVMPGRRDLAEAVARNLFKLMAYKDEYEVARLYAQTDFLKRLEETFEGDWSVQFNLAPPLIAAIDPASGRPRKRAFGPSMGKVFVVLAKLRRLRGTPLDLFGYTAERREERRLIADYEALLSELVQRLDAANHAAAVELARLPDEIRGFGPVKRASIERAKAREATLRAALDAPARPALAAE